MEYIFDDIESVECIGSFDNEYVYDVEVEDGTHTFIANDILIHNSVYVTLKDVLDSCDYKGDPVDFFLKINDLRLTDYLNKCFDLYAQKYNTKNIQNLELEKISYNAIMIAKKKYILDLAWTDSNIRFDPQTKIKPVGIEMIQSSTPVFARKILMDIIRMILQQGGKSNYSEIVAKLKKYKEEFKLQDPDNISISKNIGNYEKFVLEDRKQITLADKCPMHCRASAIYNHIVQNNPKYKIKYNLIRTADKVRIYYAKDPCEVFAYQPGNYPIEFAPPIDYDIQFAKIVVSPLNRYITAVGMKEIPDNLIYSESLF